jgi:ligand-binding sensor domain-containing protein
VRKRAGVFIVVLVLTGAPLPAFNADEPRTRYTVTSWTESDGMPSSYVRAVAQDQAGYLWLATYSGLVRFDGVRFAAWKSRDGNSLPSEDLSALLIARDGNLWVGGYGGVTRIVRGGIDKDASSPEGFFKGSVAALLQDERGHIWAAGQSGVAEFDGTRWRRLGSADGLPERAGTRLHKEADGTLWVGTSVGLHRRRANTHSFERVGDFSFAIEDLAQDASGRIVVPHPTNLITRLGDRPVALPNPDMARLHGTRLLRDGEGNLWIGTRGKGLVRLPAADSVQCSSSLCSSSFS